MDERILEHHDESDWATPSLLAEHPRFEEMEVFRGQILSEIPILSDTGADF